MPEHQPGQDPILDEFINALRDAAAHETAKPQIEVTASTMLGEITYNFGHYPGTDREVVFYKDGPEVIHLADTQYGTPPREVWAHLSVLEAASHDPFEYHETVKAYRRQYEYDREMDKARHRPPEPRQESVYDSWMLDKKWTYESEVEDLRNELADGEISQSEFDRRYENMQPIRDEIAVWDAAQAELELENHRLDQLDAELTSMGLRADALSTYDWSEVEEPGFDLDV